MSEQIKFLKGLKANLPASGALPGTMYCCTDTGGIYITNSNGIPQLIANINTDTGVTSVGSSGSGNAVTSMSYNANTRKLTYNLGNSFLPSAGGNLTGHLYLTGAKENSSISNTSQIVFGTSTNNHVAISSNANALVINPTTSSTTNQIILYLDKASVFPNGIKAKLTGNADTATKFAAAQTVALTGDVTGSVSSQAGWSVATTLANSGVSAGSYGPSASVTITNGGSVSIPYITVDAKGRITQASTIAATLPKDSFIITAKKTANGDVLDKTVAEIEVAYQAGLAIFCDYVSSSLAGEKVRLILTSRTSATQWLFSGLFGSSLSISLNINNTTLTESYQILGTITGVSAGTGLSGGGTANAVTLSLANSGVTAGSYGPSANASPDHGKSFSVPYFTVDAKGRITAASTKTITLPGINNATISVAAGKGLTDGGSFTTNQATAGTITLNVGAGTGISVTDNAVSLATSGVTAGSYGPSTNTSPTFGESFTIPYITLDTYGRATTASTKTVTLPNDRLFITSVPTGTSIPANANLNTTTYLKVGRYYCSANSTVATFTNCPTTDAFMMVVYSPLSTTIDNETTKTWVYRLRELTTYRGETYRQYCYAGDTANSWSYGAWTRIIQTDDAATTSASGLMSAADKTKLNGIATGAEVNQNAFSNITVGSTIIAAESKTDTLTLTAGSNITLTPDATNDKITIAATNTLNTAGSTNSASKLFLIGAASQATSVQTYSNSTVYMTGGTLTANSFDGMLTATSLGTDGSTINFNNYFHNGLKLYGISSEATLTNAPDGLTESSRFTLLSLPHSTSKFLQFAIGGEVNTELKLYMRSGSSSTQDAWTQVPTLNTIATTAQYGVTKLSTSTSSTSTALAATASAVKAAYDLANSKAPAYQYSTTDLTAGVTELATGTLYFVYE